MTTLRQHLPHPSSLARGLAVALWPLVAAWLVVAGLARRLIGRDAESPARTRSEEAERVRRLADRERHRDPGFAADLYAAAARHESGDT